MVIYLIMYNLIILGFIIILLQFSSFLGISSGKYISIKAWEDIIIYNFEKNFLTW